MSKWLKGYSQWDPRRRLISRHSHKLTIANLSPRATARQKCKGSIENLLISPLSRLLERSYQSWSRNSSASEQTSIQCRQEDTGEPNSLTQDAWFTGLIWELVKINPFLILSRTN